MQYLVCKFSSKLSMRKEVAADIRNIFHALDPSLAVENLGETVAKYEKMIPKPAAWMESNLPEGLTVFQVPESHRIRLRTSNACERINQQIKCRTRVAGLFPNEASVLRFVSAILMEISEEWETGKAYLPLDPEPHDPRNSTKELNP